MPERQAHIGKSELAVSGFHKILTMDTTKYLQYSTMWDDSGGALTPVDATIMSPNATRDDWVIGVVAFGEYRIRDWIAINLTFEYEGDITDYEVGYVGGYIPESYHKFAVFGGVRAHY